MAEPNIDTVRGYIAKYSNWGRWGEEDERGTLNHVTPEAIAHAASLVKKGRTLSLALPFDENGPQKGTFNRFNPIHLMTRVYEFLFCGPPLPFTYAVGSPLNPMAIK